MDFATPVGLVAGVGPVANATVSGGNAIIFVNPPSLMIVVGGTLAVVLMKFPMGEVFNLSGPQERIFFKAPSAVEIINQIIEMAMLARKEACWRLRASSRRTPFCGPRSAGRRRRDTGHIKRAMNQELDQMVAGRRGHLDEMATSRHVRDDRDASAWFRCSRRWRTPRRSGRR